MKDPWIRALGAAIVDRPAGAIWVAAFLVITLLLALAMRALHHALQRERERRADAEQELGRTASLEALAWGLSKAHTTDEVTRASLAELLPAAGASAGVVALVNDRGDRLEVVEAMGHADPTAAKRYTVPLTSKTVLTEVVRRQIPFSFASREDRANGFGEQAIDPVIEEGEGAIVLPLLVAGRTLGVVALSYSDACACGSDERAFLSGAVQRTGQALDRAMRYERAERARADLEAYRERADLEIRERQKAEDALRESEGRYRALAARTTRLYTLSAGLSESVTLDAVARMIVRQGRVVAGASAGSVALLVEDGGHFETVFSEEYPPPLVEAWHRFPAESGLCATAAVRTGEPVFIPSFVEWQQQYPRSAAMAADGGFASAAVLPLLGEGSPIGALSFHFTAPVNFDDDYRALLRSVAHHAAQAIDRARLFETAERARADAEAANRSRDDFLSIVSHELRTPLSAVLGWASMLRSQAVDPAHTSRALEAIFRNATRQAHLIDELLDVSRIVAGRAPLDLQEVDVSASVRGAVETIMPLAEAKRLDVRVSPLSGVLAVADPHRLEQVFVNLLGNAVKFTPEGGVISIGVTRSDRTIDVRVEDTGRGIDAAFLPHVFERFRQADSTAARSAGGLGLGLFIARRLVDAHGGLLTVESDGENRGAAFTVSLSADVGRPAQGPCALAPLVRGESEDAMPALGGVRVLIVDDEPDSRDMMAAALETCGATVRSASSVESAVEILTVRQERFDVLLSDIAMPGKDGYELIRQVRAHSIGDLAGIPAAAVTACTGASEHQRALSAGFHMHLIKPLRPGALARAVANLARLDQEAAATALRRA